MKKIRLKARVVPQPCMFRDTCSGACDWCNSHSYSEACVPMLQQQVHDLQKRNARQSDTIKALCKSREELTKENRQLRERLGIDDLW